MVSDAGSGIQETFVRSRSMIFWGKWATAVNPLAIPSNVWAVDLKVTDNKGNVAEETIYDWPSFAKGPFVFIIFLSATIVFVFKRTAKHRKDIIINEAP